MQPYTCQCGQLTQICRDEVTAEQWTTFETFYAMAYDWALDHLPVSADDDETARDAAESFATRYASDEWDNEEPCSFPIYLKCEQNAGRPRGGQAARARPRRPARRSEATRCRMADRSATRSPTRSQLAPRGDYPEALLAIGSRARAPPRRRRHPGQARPSGSRADQAPGSELPEAVPAGRRIGRKILAHTP